MSPIVARVHRVLAAVVTLAGTFSPASAQPSTVEGDATSVSELRRQCAPYVARYRVATTPAARKQALAALPDACWVLLPPSEAHPSNRPVVPIQLVPKRPPRDDLCFIGASLPKCPTILIIEFPLTFRDNAWSIGADLGLLVNHSNQAFGATIGAISLQGEHLGSSGMAVKARYRRWLSPMTGLDLIFAGNRATAEDSADNPESKRVSYWAGAEVGLSLADMVGVTVGVDGFGEQFNATAGIRLSLLSVLILVAGWADIHK